MSDQRVVAKYWIETAVGVERAAESLAGEQSSGTFVAVPGETEELRRRFRARVEKITPLEGAAEPSLPGAAGPRSSQDGPPKTESGKPYERAEIEVSFPLENMGPALTTLVSTVAGNLFELREFSGLKLLDLELPPAFGEAYLPPQFGVEGTRKLANVHDRPLVGTIVKPSVGLTPQQTADLAGDLAAANIDFIKDDELMANPPHSPLEERVKCVMRVLNEAADRAGKKVMYAFNISDDTDAMRKHHDTVLQNGGTCVMVSVNSVGLAAVAQLRRYSQLPIHAHRNGWGMFTRSPALGIAFPAYQKLWRLAGVDHLHVNGLSNKFWEPDDSVVRSIAACRAPLLGGRHIMPVVASGQWGGQAPETYRRCQTLDLIYLAGGGMMAHPDGPAAGCRSLRQAWEAAAQGITLEDYAKSHVELRRSLEKFGKPATARSSS